MPAGSVRSLIFVGGLILGLLPVASAAPALLDWSDWEKYRATVQHPSGAIKAPDLVRARENLRRYPWAQNHLRSLESGARRALGQISPAWLETMIPETTPGDAKFTPCPACRALGKPVHPHGLWSWSAAHPDRLVCDVCTTVFPHADYPEEITVRSTWGRPQTFTYAGGEPFVIFGYRTGRPSFTSNLRARKVGYAAGVCHTLAEAFLLTGKLEYARGVRSILLRFAAVYPHWLVHVGYGEYADLPPHVAAQEIQQLSAPELCPPPNRPDRRLHTGYWSAGRASGVGQESHFVRRMVESYDYTCTATDPTGTPLYTDAERRQIERDLLLESTVLLTSDPGINNKSVGNRTAAALVGLCVGHPGLVRFGWDGFQQTIDGWFLPDGTTSESPAYANMTLGNVWDMPQALRGYSEPPGYAGPDGRRRVAADLYHGTAYERIWENCFKGLQGDLTYPPYADSYVGTRLGTNFLELMVANYPERPQYLTLLRESAGLELSRGSAALALYYREPGLESRPSPPITLPDWCSPELRLGHLRTGADGRESLLTLSASHWGNHHHYDSLNLYYWKQGHEVLSDLGYLWDHPRKHQASRTVAHNTVVIDEEDQRTRDRGGEVHLFRVTPHVKVMEASSRAYASAPVYRRTSALIDHGEGRSYVVDFFRVQGGRRQDFVYHASHRSCDLLDVTRQPTTEKLYDFARVQAVHPQGAWRVRWSAGPQLTAVAWNLSQPGERAYVADGWGQRDWKNSDLGATLPYIVRRTEGDAERRFVSVFEAHAGTEPFVRRVSLRDDGVVIVETALGTDQVRSAAEPGTLALPGGRTLAGRVAAVSIQGGRVAWEFVE
ncbi:MAG: heparinase II/III family protein [Verrucomicrobia bacterium]|nr:heparinase II/III family protein [Verrucomicrobiota bacterium]